MIRQRVRRFILYILRFFRISWHWRIGDILTHKMIRDQRAEESRIESAFEKYLESIPEEYRDWPLSWYESLDDGDFKSDGSLKLSEDY